MASRPRRSPSSRRSRRSIRPARHRSPPGHAHPGQAAAGHVILPLGPRAARSSWGWRRSGSSAAPAPGARGPAGASRPPAPPAVRPNRRQSPRSSCRSTPRPSWTFGRATPVAETAPAPVAPRRRSGGRVRSRLEAGPGRLRRAAGPRSRAGPRSPWSRSNAAPDATVEAAPIAADAAAPSRSWWSPSSTRTCSRESSSPSSAGLEAEPVVETEPAVADPMTDSQLRGRALLGPRERVPGPGAGAPTGRIRRGAQRRARRSW
jgi:hypothetical protein